jgi:hypothetical protein
LKVIKTPKGEEKMNRTVGIVLTIVTVLCCACPGLIMCVFGGMIGAGVPLTTTLGDVSSVQHLPGSYGFGLICLSIFLIAIPIVVGFLTLRNKPAPVESQVPLNPPQ